MTTITVPEGYQYVGAALLSTVVLLLGQNTTVSIYRKRSGIKYPQLYAEKAEAAASKDAYLFNCAQRAHQNTLENIPIIYTTTLLAGLKFPIFAASTCALWTLGRVSYTRGYLTGEPDKRGSYLYIAGTAGLMGLLLMSVYSVGDLICSKL